VGDAIKVNTIMDNDFKSVHQGFSFIDFLSQIGYENLSGSSIQEVLRDKVVDVELLQQAYQEYQNINFFDLSKNKISISREEQIVEKSAYELGAIAIKSASNGVEVGFINPLDKDKIASVESLLNAYITPLMVKQSEFKRAMRLTYRKVQKIQNYADQISVSDNFNDSVEIIAASADSQVSELANMIVRDAFEMSASDIHIEKEPNRLNIRLRIDGMLQEYALHNTSVSDHLIRYFKLLADVDITQDLTPSEGKKVTIVLDEEEINLRFSFMPTYYGQSVVIRLLGDVATYNLEEKIASPVYVAEIRSYLTKTYGTFLISGPTGSGKTTTLYSALQEVNDQKRKIITLEDPVEAKLPGVNQVQVNDVIHYGFEKGIRAALRQDPDIMMVGEIRDEATANIAVQAAITGHLVLASLHARSVVEIPIRLLNLKVDPYLMATTLRLNSSQRLVKRVCPNCKEPHQLQDQEQEFIQKYLPEYAGKDMQLASGAGCYFCQNTGFSHRSAVFEILHLSEEMILSLARDNIGGYLEIANTALKGKRLLDNAMQLAVAGEIPFSEVMHLNFD
jgi:MSHA biogenesis protein MshE